MVEGNKRAIRHRNGPFEGPFERPFENEYEDVKGVIRISKSKKDGQRNGQMKRTNNYLQNPT